MKRSKRVDTSNTNANESNNKRTEEGDRKLDKIEKIDRTPPLKTKESKRILAANASQKKINDFTKKIENVEFLIKLEQKNKSQLEDNFETKITKLENQIEKNEKELEQTLRELNVKEAKIFEIQKAKLETFKQEIFKFETIYAEIEERLEEIFKTINSIKSEECNSYNKTFIIYEDYLSFNNELEMLKAKMKNLREVLITIEKSYPKEFEFLLEDIQIEKDLKEIQNKKNKILKEIKDKEKSKITLARDRDNKKNELKRISDEVIKIEKLYTSPESLNHLIRLESYITSHVTESFSYEKVKAEVFSYYEENRFDPENEINVLLIKNLYTKMDEMRKEFNQIMNDKNLHKSKLENSLKAMEKRAMKGRPTKDMQNTKFELDTCIEEISMLELNCKKKEALFNKYLILLRNKCTKTPEESYVEKNPVLCEERDYDERFKNYLLQVIKQDDTHNKEDKGKNMNLVEIYFKELCDREKLVQNSVLKSKTFVGAVDRMKTELQILEEGLANVDGEIYKIKLGLEDVANNERLLLSKIENRNNNLNKNMENLTEIEYQNYYKNNEIVLKKMKSIYGNKILDKVTKTQKVKFMENIIGDHTFKKNKVNEFVKVISKFEETQEYFYSNIRELERDFKKVFKQYEDMYEIKNRKLQEEKFLTNSKSEMRSQMDKILERQVKELEKEKDALQLKFNISYFIEKAENLKLKTDEMKAEKKRLLSEYNHYKTIIVDREKKLYLENLEFKNQVITLQHDELSDGDIKSDSNPFRSNKTGSQINESNDKLFKVNTEENNELFDNRILESNEEDNIYDESLNKMHKDQAEREENNEMAMLEEIVKAKNPVKLNSSSLNRDLNDSFKNNSFLVATEKILPLVSGVNLYKRFNTSSQKNFDPKNAKENPPESCGYAQRTFKINLEEDTLEIKNPKNPLYTENKINLQNVKKILVNGESKKIISRLRNITLKPNNVMNSVFNYDFIPFSLIVENNSIDLIAQSYQIFACFSSAIEEITYRKKHLKEILRYIENKI